MSSITDRILASMDTSGPGAPPHLRAFDRLNKSINALMACDWARTLVGSLAREGVTALVEQGFELDASGLTGAQHNWSVVEQSLEASAFLGDPLTGEDYQLKVFLTAIVGVPDAGRTHLTLQLQHCASKRAEPTTPAKVVAMASAVRRSLLDGDDFLAAYVGHAKAAASGLDEPGQRAAALRLTQALTATLGQ